MSKIKDVTMTNTVAQVEGNIVSDMDGEKVMLSVRNGKYYNLGEIGGEIWEQMKEPISIEILVNKFLKEYDVERSECEEQTITFIKRLAEEGLVTIS